MVLILLSQKMILQWVNPRTTPCINTIMYLYVSIVISNIITLYASKVDFISQLYCQQTKLYAYIRPHVVNFSLLVYQTGLY